MAVLALTLVDALALPIVPSNLVEKSDQLIQV